MKSQTLPQQYDLVYNDHEYTIYYQDQPLKTRGGALFSHSNDRLMKHLLTDFQTVGVPEEFTLSNALLFEFQKDHSELSDDFLLREFDAIARQDPFIRLKSGGEKTMNHTPTSVDNQSGEGDDSMFNLVFWSFSSILKNLNIFIEEFIGQAEQMEDVENPLIFLLTQQYIQASPEKRSAIRLLFLFHQAGLVLPMLFVNGKLTVSEYAKGVIALKFRREMTEERLVISFPDEAYRNIAELPVTKASPADYKQLFDDGAVIQDYLSFFQLPVSHEKQSRELIASGESGQLEFKSTLRWDLRGGKTNPAVERASLKTICAFLNTSGGTLLIGVRDDGSIEGIESDKLLNDDRFLLHLWTLIRTCLGRDVSPYIQTNLEKLNEKTICIVTCARSLRPVFLRQPGFDEEFYIRLGPSSASLDISEALKFIADRFQENEK